eukprot:1149626-Pelagomonas_calceolata.AAC.10
MAPISTCTTCTLAIGTTPWHGACTAIFEEASRGRYYNQQVTGRKNPRLREDNKRNEIHGTGGKLTHQSALDLEGSAPRVWKVNYAAYNHLL